ncbi:hypothetical protein BpHYR1_005445 [Brachionus plicatilis]|uniref:Reverse transcriptase zinc-binding domain-containing protein n=1 Tax=Brachionus plicatilis TaxID=10195 RepID=A0A3M7RH64_BRAPC|nr:hypothetical protein BpHYR1_005445 [Brachionus plicatilis]
MLNGLPTLDRFKNYPNRCSLCLKKKENIPHIFFECELTNKLLIEIWRTILPNKNKILTRENVIYNQNCTSNEVKILSAFKIAVWKFRSIVKMNKTNLTDIPLKRALARYRNAQIKRKPLSLDEKLEISNDFNKNNL